MKSSCTHNRAISTTLLLGVLGLWGCQSTSVVARTPLPKVVTQEGRHQFQVEGQPYLILGAQTNNSSNYSSALADVWPVVEKLQANTLSIPVAWEQIEPKEGEFDFSFLDTLISEAKARDVRLMLLWFASWKNNAPHYAPSWVKLNNKRFPRVITKEGKHLNSLSPLGKQTLAADKKAFEELMTYLRDNDPGHQVIMVQVQNEVGTYGTKRDFSPMAQAEFDKPVPAELIEGLEKSPGTWAEVFGKDADEFFHAWHIGRYVDEIAAAGKAIKALPMNVNVALRHPENPGDGYSMGGATDNVIDLWKIAAPHIDMLSPDIYYRDHKTVTRVLELYARPDNPLLVSEIGNAQPYARYFFDTMGQQGIGFVPFGMDNSNYANFPLGAREVTDEIIEHFAANYRLLGPMVSKWAQLSFEQPVWGVSEPVDNEAQQAPETDQSEEEVAASYTQHLDLGLWDAEITYGRHMFWIDPPVGNHPSSGGALIARLSDNEYLITAYRARVTLGPSTEQKDSYYMIERVEEGHFDAQGNWVFERVWNGDQTDWGLNFTSEPQLLKVRMATYQP